MPILAAALALTTGLTAEPVKRALLIGVSDYKGTGMDDLGGPQDVQAISQVIQARWNFLPANISSLTKKVTKKDIETGLAKLVSEIKTGDVVYLHYSGHGTQIEDDNRDESDGFDEALMPSGAKDGDWASHMTDDEIAAWIAKLKAKGAGSIFFTLDSCHSGGVSRGRAKPRGRLNPKARGGSQDDFNQSEALGYTFLAAAQSDERAWENFGQGVFSSALVEALSDLPAGATWREALGRVYDGVMEGNQDERQTPVLEGDPNRLIFDSKTSSGETSFTIRTSFRDLRIDGGRVHGLMPGTEIEISLGAQKFKAQLKEVNAIESTIKLDASAKIAPEKLSGARAKVVALGIAKPFLTLNLSQLTAKDQAQLTSALAEVKTVEVAQKPGPSDLSLRLANSKFELRGPGDELIESAESTEAIADAIRRRAKWKLVQELGVGQSDCEVKVEMEFVPVETMPDPNGRTLRGQPLPVFAKAILNASQTPFRSPKSGYFSIRVRAMSPQGGPGAWDPYVAVLNLAGGGEVKQLWPSPSRPTNQDTWRLNADGKWRYLQSVSGILAEDADANILARAALFFIDPEKDGRAEQIFKLMATRKPVSYQPLLQPGARRGTTGLEKLLNGLATGQSRGEALEPEPGDWMAKNLYVRPAE